MLNETGKEKPQGVDKNAGGSSLENTMQSGQEMEGRMSRMEGQVGEIGQTLQKLLDHMQASPPESRAPLGTPYRHVPNFGQPRFLKAHALGYQLNATQLPPPPAQHTTMDQSQLPHQYVTGDQCPQENVRPPEQYEPAGLRMSQPAQNASQPMNSSQRLEDLVEQLARNAENAQFSNASASLPYVTGKEGRSRLEGLFLQLEMQTIGWIGERRALLLYAKLRDEAKMIVDSLGDHVKFDYDEMKFALLDAKANMQSLQSIAQQKLIRGVRPGFNESVQEYGYRVLQVVKEANPPGTSQNVLDSAAIAHFLFYLGDQRISDLLSLQRQYVPFRELINQAAMLKESRVGTSQRDSSACYECGETGHLARDCSRRQAFVDAGRRGQEFGRTSWSQRTNQRSSGSGARFNNPASRIQPRMAGGNVLPVANAPSNNRAYSSAPPQRNHVSFMQAEASQSQPQQNNSALITQLQSAGSHGPAMPTFTQMSTMAGGMIVSTSQAHVSRTSAEKSIRVVAVDETRADGLTHSLVGSDGATMQIGTPQGSLAVTFVDILGVSVQSLVDNGADISTISARCLNNIARFNELDLAKMNVHQTLFPSCRAANDAKLPLLAAITLPVKRGDMRVFVEFQVPETPPLYPVILGTNCLAKLGYKMIDTVTGEDLLLGNRIASTAPPQSYSVRATEEQKLGAHVPQTVQCQTDAADGTFLFRDAGNQRDESLVEVKSGRVEFTGRRGRSKAIAENQARVTATDQLPIPTLYRKLRLRALEESFDDQPFRYLGPQESSTARLEAGCVERGGRFGDKLSSAWMRVDFNWAFNKLQGESEIPGPVACGGVQARGGGAAERRRADREIVGARGVKARHRGQPLRGGAQRPVHRVSPVRNTRPGTRQDRRVEPPRRRREL